MPAEWRVLSCFGGFLFAVVRSGGKQYRVREGATLTLERLPGEAGDSIELRDVLLLGDGDSVTVGTPVVDGARVVGTITEQGRSPKIIVFRYKAKTRARKKNGHRQQFTRLKVDDILAPGQEPKPKQEISAAAPVEEAEAPRKSRRTRKTEAEAPAEAPVAEEAAAEAAADAAPAEAEAKPKRTRRKAE
jgi:large subunit ribosomal protein L21